MTTNFLYTQMPNTKGNQSKHTPSKSGGATNVVGNKVNQATKGTQGAPKASGNIYPVGNKVSVSKPKCDYGHNDSYRNGTYYPK